MTLRPPAPQLLGVPSLELSMGLVLPLGPGMKPHLLSLHLVSRGLSLRTSTWGTRSPVPRLRNPQLYSRNAPMGQCPWMGHIVSASFLGHCDMPRARKGPRPCGVEWSAGLPNASQFSQSFCPNPSRFGQNARENWPENARPTHFGHRASARQLPGHGPAS